MIFFDTTKTGRPGRRSGLDRVSSRLREAFGPKAQAVVWEGRLRDPRTRNVLTLRPGDAFLTSELFSEDERPGFTAFLEARPCPCAAIFHDAIPLQLPHITWPQSVARHPGYMKLLSHFDRVWAVSQTSRTDLLGFWQWQGIARTPPVDVIALGANFNATPRVTILPHPATANLSLRRGASLQPRSATSPIRSAPQLLCLGIIEPRKNQLFLLNVCEDLWAEGLAFELHVVGRVNPHFGAPTLARLKALRRSRKKSLHFHEAATDETVARLYASSRASVFPTIAEGCGLPLLESLWMGVPCVCSDLPVLRENSTGGGCVAVPVNDLTAWKDTLRRVLTDDAFHQKLCTQATERPLPTWNDVARTLASGLGDSSGR